MTITRFLWTGHVELRLNERHITPGEVEGAIINGHGDREPNRGDADWRVYGRRADGQAFAVIYDNPAGGDPDAVRIVSVWPLRAMRRP